MGRKDELINMLCQLYTLKNEGKHVQATIESLERQLCEECDEEDDQDDKVATEDDD